MARPRSARGRTSHRATSSSDRRASRSDVQAGPWPVLVQVIPLLLLSVMTTFYRLDGQSLWADEGNSVAQAVRSVGEIARHAAADIHPPLYYVLLRGWTQLFGTSEIALRSLSAVGGVAVVLLTWAIARALWGNVTALVSGTLLALHPFLVYYAQEVRMYIFTALWAALAAYAVCRIVLREGRARAAYKDVVPMAHPALRWQVWDGVYLLAVAAGLWTHYAFPVIPLALAGVYLAWVATTRRTIPVWPRLIRWLTVHVGALVLYMPWMPIALARVRAWPRPSDLLSLEEGVALSWQWFALGPSATEAHTRWLWLWAALLLVALWPWRRETRWGYRRPHWLTWGLPLAWWLAPLVLLGVLGLFRPAYIKFLIAGLPAFVVLMARGVLAPWEALHPLPRRWGRVLGGMWAGGVLVLLLGMQISVLARYYYDPAAARDDYRAIAQYIAEVAGPEDAILLNAPGQQDVFRYYYQGPLPVYPLPETRPPQADRLYARLETIVRRHRTLYVLLWGTAESDPEGLMERWLNTHAYKALDVWRGNVRFLIYATPRYAEPPVSEVTVNARLGEAIWLRRLFLWNPTVRPGEVVQVRLTWEAERTPSERYKVFLQLLGVQDRLIAQRDSEPVGGNQPTNTWRPGEVVEDNYGILIPLATPPGRYRLIVGMYDPITGARVPVVQDGETRDHVVLPVSIEVKRPAVPPPPALLPFRYRNDERWGEIRLLGHDRYRRGYRHRPDMAIPPGDFLHLTLYWQAVEAPTARWWVTVTVVDGWANVVASLTDDLSGPEYPTTLWEAGEVVRGEFDVYIPPEVKPGTYGVRVQLWRGDTPVGDPVPLGTITVGPPEGG